MIMKSYNTLIVYFYFTLAVVNQNTAVLGKRLGTGRVPVQQHDGDGQRELQSGNSVFFLEMGIECFSKYTTVYVQSNGNGGSGSGSSKATPINNVQIGDKVLTSSGKYETIYTIGHTNPSKVTQFIQIYTTPDTTSSSSGSNNNEDQQQPLEVTRNHMIYVAHNEHPIPAHNIQIGDYVQTMKGPRKVIQLHTVMRKGIYNPLTMDGTIVVNDNGIIASTYSALFSNNEYIVVSPLSENKMMNNKISHQDFFDTLLQPYKYFCTHISMQSCKGTPKSMTEITSNNQQEGDKIPMILQIAHNLYTKYMVVTSQHQEGENNNNANSFLLLVITLIYLPLRVFLMNSYNNIIIFMILMVVVMKNDNHNTGWFMKQRRNNLIRKEVV